MSDHLKLDYYERPKLQMPKEATDLLLHSCCAPCAGEIMEALAASEIKTTVYFYNPNIHPKEEYEIRKNENRRFCEKLGFECIDADYDKDGWATTKAIVISKAMRKITQMIARQKVALVFTNQLRQKLGVMFGDPWTTSGGKALPFHSSTRSRPATRLRSPTRETPSENRILRNFDADMFSNELGESLTSGNQP